MGKNLSDLIEGALKEESPTAEAVKTLIRVEKREKGKDSDIELKTDLDKNAVCIHTAIDILNKVLESPEKDFEKMSVLGDLVNRKERKLLSKDRKSRQEIVDISKQPEQIQNNDLRDSGIKRFFTPRK